jgi:hypothetical protein
MRIEQKRSRWRAALATLMLCAGLCGWADAARAYITIQVYAARDTAAYENLPSSDTGGLIKIGDDYQFTLPGVCGMQFTNIVGWHWSDANGPMANLPSNGVAIPNNYNFQYTGPYSGQQGKLFERRGGVK